MSPPALAVVIPTFERPASVAKTIGDVVDQLRDGDEVVVIDQSSDEALQQTAACCAEHPRVRHLARIKPSLPDARNAGIRATRAPIVLFFDDDVRLHPGCLDGHRAPYRDPTVGGVVGAIVETRLRPNAATTTNRVERSGRIRTRLDGEKAVDIDTLKGANMSLLRRALNEAGPFDPNYLGNALLEDADLSTRVTALGWRLRFAPTARVDHHHLPTGGVRVGRAARWRFHNTAYFVRRHRPRRHLPWVVGFHAALAAKIVVRERDVGGGIDLARAFAQGWGRAGTIGDLSWGEER